MITRFTKVVAILLIFSSSLFFGCHSEKSETVGEADSTSQGNNIEFEDENKFYAIPSPIEAVGLLKKAGATYDNSYMNPTSNVSKYSTTPLKALNLGVYGADLSFAAVFEQSQDAMLSLKAASVLSKQIGISGAFGNDVIKRVEANIQNRDSMISIITESFLLVDEYLKENELPKNAAFVLAGGWIECLFIATSIGNVTNDPQIINRIVEQKLSLHSLINLLEENGNDETNISVLKDLNELKTLFDETELSSSKIEAITNKDKQTTTLKSSGRSAISDSELEKITAKIKSIRFSITQ